MDKPPLLPVVVLPDPLKHFARERWWVKLLALLILKWSIPLTVLAAIGASWMGWV
jgi:hypothetical protein